MTTAWKLNSSSSKRISTIYTPDVTFQTVVCNIYQSVNMKMFAVLVQIFRAAFNIIRNFFYFMSFHRFFFNRKQMPMCPYATLKTLVMMVLMRTVLDQTQLIILQHHPFQRNKVALSSLCSLSLFFPCILPLSKQPIKL